ncbi:MAG: hypothetical protein ABIP28_13645, partial [Mucilaginibacter sp.]
MPKNQLEHNGLLRMLFTVEFIRAFTFLILFLGIFPFNTRAQTEDPAILKSDSLYGKGEYNAAIPILQNRLKTAKNKKEQA